MNENSLALLVSFFIAYYENRYLYYVGTERLSIKHWTDNKGKLRIPEIKKITIQYNVNADIDVVGNYCKSALANNVVENCKSIKNELEHLISQEGETDQNKYLIAQTRTYLDEGIRIEKFIYEKLYKVRSIVDEAAKKFSIVRTVKALEMIPKITPQIEDGYAYIYSSKYKQSVLTLQDDLLNLLSNHYIAKLKVIKCDITELSQFKSTYTRVAKILREHNCEALATATEAQISKVETELKAKQHYASSLVECEKDLALSVTTEKYQECCDLSNKIQGWLSFFSAAKELPETIVLPFQKRLQEAAIHLDEQKKSIIRDYEATLESISNAKSSAALSQLDDKLCRFYQMQIDEDISLHIVVVRDFIQAAISEIGRLPKDVDGLSQFVAQYNNADNPYCWSTILACATMAKEELEREQAKWVQKYLVIAESNYNTMSQHECSTWLERTKNLPAYFSEITINRYNGVKELIENRLHSSRVEAIISMYDALTDGEKAEFKRLLESK